MLRVCTTLLYALMADAARSNLKMERAGAVDQVMNTVSSLLHGENADSTVMSNLRALAVQSATPLATDNLNSALTDVIQSIVDNVESKIRVAHDAAQTAVDTTIEDLKTWTKTAVDQKATADLKDEAWFGCIHNEKAKSVAIEGAQQKVAQSETKKTPLCAAETAAEMFNLIKPALADFNCDISSGQCNTGLVNYEEGEVQKFLNAVESDLGAKTQFYNNAKSECDAAKADVLTDQGAQQTAEGELTNKKQTCLTMHTERSVSMCTFGRNLQSKCQKFTNHQDLVALIDGEGNEFSESDRANEWRTTIKTKCLLQKVLAGFELNAAASLECDAVDYATDVGVIDKHEADLETAMTPDQFECSEEVIRFFNGKAWSVPENEASASSQYTENDFTPRVSLALETPPFAFCPA